MCILCEAGRIVTVDETVKGDKRADMLVTEYKGLVQSLSRHLKQKDVYVHKFGQDDYDEKVGELLESVVMTNTGTHGDDLYFGGGGGDNLNAGNGNTDNRTIATNEE